MSVFSHSEFHDHEQVVFCRDAASGLRAIIAIHSTHLGPALGGIRMYPYASDEDALTDVLRLARGMSYKAALAGLPLGGGKSVIIGDPHRAKTPALLRAMGEAIERLGGRYIGAEDSGTAVADLKVMSETTDHVCGTVDKEGLDGGTRSGDPSPATALGVFLGIRAAVQHALGRDELHGVRVAIQGVGNVGRRLGRYLHDAGAELVVCDSWGPNLDRAATELNARAVEPEAIYAQDVEVFAPCALGAVLNDVTIPQLKARIVAGSANNQLAEARHGDLLRRRGIVYAPDYVINAGGLIDVFHERERFFDTDSYIIMDEFTLNTSSHDSTIDGIHRIPQTLSAILEQAEREQRSTQAVADSIAEDRLRG